MEIGGSVATAYSRVREVFGEVLAEQPGTGASFAVWHDGEWIVDVWGGYADAAHTRPWQRGHAGDAVLGDQADRRACPCSRWSTAGWSTSTPRCSATGRSCARAATVRDVLSHRAGLVVLDEDAPEEAFYDWDLMCSLLARQEPSWTPGAAQGESALFYGHLLGQVVRAVDGRSLGRFLREEVCGPHDLDFHIGLVTPSWPGSPT